MRNTRDLMREAYAEAAAFSDDRSTQNGALLVSPAGVVLRDSNRFPAAALACNPANHERPRKYAFTEHAERAVIYKAATYGISTRGLIMVCPWACCAECARAIVMSGITKVVAHKQAFDMSPPRWQQPITEGLEILAAGGVEHELWDGKVGGVENLFNGEVWTP